MSRDPSVYPNAERFSPERFLVGDEKVHRDQSRIAFGFGRRWNPFMFDSYFQSQMTYVFRVCPGRDLADLSVCYIDNSMEPSRSSSTSSCFWLFLGFWRRSISERQLDPMGRWWNLRLTTARQKSSGKLFTTSSLCNWPITPKDMSNPSNVIFPLVQRRVHF